MNLYYFRVIRKNNIGPGPYSGRKEYIMYTHKYYNLVTRAKEFVAYCIDQGADPLHEIHAGDMSRPLRSNQCCPSINTRAAVATVLTSGTFLESGQFMMPSTRACLDVFRHVRKQLSNQRPLVVSVADSNHDIYPVKF